MAMDNVGSSASPLQSIIDYANGQYTIDGEAKSEEEVNAELASSGSVVRVHSELKRGTRFEFLLPQAA